MKICPNCGAQLDDNATFCTACGANVSAQQPAAAPQPGPAPQQPAGAPQSPVAAPIPPQPGYGYAPPAAAPAYDPYDHTAEFDPKDISENKVFAMLPYLMSFIGVIIALLAAQDSPFTKFHVRQGLKILVTEILVTIVGLIIPILGWIALGICLIILLVIEIICFFQVCKGKAKEPAIIKSLGFLK